MACTAESLYDATRPGIPEIGGLRSRMGLQILKPEDAQTSEHSRQPPINPPSIALPLYIYPSPHAWAPLYSAAAKNPSIQFNVVINPANGPGSHIPDSNYIAQVSKLRTLPNVRLFGYVHLQWGDRDLREICSDISIWARWAEYEHTDIRVDGIFIDESPSDVAALEYVAEISRHADSAFRSEDDVQVWLNPGVPVPAEFYDVADMVNAYENSYESWLAGKRIEGIAEELRARSTVMLHSYGGSAEGMQEEASRLRSADFCSVLVSTDSHYTTFSSMWSDLVNAMSD